MTSTDKREMHKIPKAGGIKQCSVALVDACILAKCNVTDLERMIGRLISKVRPMENALSKFSSLKLIGEPTNASKLITYLRPGNTCTPSYRRTFNEQVMLRIVLSLTV